VARLKASQAAPFAVRAGFCYGGLWCWWCPRLHLPSLAGLLILTLLSLGLRELATREQNMTRLPPAACSLDCRADQHLLSVLLRDGVLFYVLTLGLSVCNVAIILAAPVTLRTVAIPLHMVLHSIMATRIVLHLRMAASRSTDVSEFTPFQTTLNGLSDMQFDRVESRKSDDIDADGESSEFSVGPLRIELFQRTAENGL